MVVVTGALPEHTTVGGRHRWSMPPLPLERRECTKPIDGARGVKAEIKSSFIMLSTVGVEIT